MSFPSKNSINLKFIHFMKNWQANILFFILLSGNSFAQVNKKTSVHQTPAVPIVPTASTVHSLPPRSIVISWKTLKQSEAPGIGKRLFLSFNKAGYNLSKHLLPIYSDRVALPFGATAANVELLDEKYIPLTDAEKSAMNSYNTKTKKTVENDIKVEITVVMQKKRPYAYFQFIPIRINKMTGGYEKLVSFSIKASPVIDENKKVSKLTQRTYAQNSILATGDWFKIAVSADGVYKMNYSFLKKLGLKLDSSLNPKSIRLFGNGGGQLPYANSAFRYDDLQENAIYVHDGGKPNIFDSTDYVLFYGQTQHRWQYNSTDKKFHHNLNVYSDSTYYFITVDLAGAGKRITSQNSSIIPPTNTVNSFDDYQFHEIEGENLITSGRIWFGEIFDIITSYNFNFSFSNIVTPSIVYAKIDLAARCDNTTYFNWTIGSSASTFTVAGVTTTNIDGVYYAENSDTLSFLSSSGSIPLTISKTTPSPSIGWLNFIELNARRNLSMTGNQMIFRDMNSVGAGKISQFTISNASSALQVWDVTDRINVKLQKDTLIGNNLQFILPTDSLREFLAFDGLNYLSPTAFGKVQNQNLHSMTQADLIIVTNPLFLHQANTLANLHRTQDNLNVEVATTDQIFNEFGSGSQDVSAIRDFVKMFYDRATDSTQLPKYLLLFGRGSYNLKSTVNNTNYVPAYESLNSSDVTASYVSDDFYGMLDDNEGNWDVTPGMLDIGVGRLPITNVSEANVAVNKITTYTSVPGTIATGNSCSSGMCYGLGDWVNTVTFIADAYSDGGFAGGFEGQADQEATKVDTTYRNYNIDKIYLDAYQIVSTPGGDRVPDASAAFNQQMERGCLIVNYTGHGGQLGFGNSRFMGVSDINSWSNLCRLPLFFTATCEFSTWDNPALISAGELTFLNPGGGTIGLMSTTRVVYSGPNFALNDSFYNYAFKPMPNGKMPRLGDLDFLTKNSMSPSDVNHRNFSLLADPALMLHYPKYDVITTGINGMPINLSKLDTVKALSKMTVNGEIRDQNGTLLTNFNGIIYPTVYDKATQITTLGNNGDSPGTFSQQQNVLFKGKASVTNGKFSFTFIVPKDINYNYGNGRISYYAHNGYLDANGYFESFIIGGTNNSAKKDTIGPNLKLYMNDNNFVYGGATNGNPKIYAVMSDSSGINTAGTGIGHSLTAVLDNNITNPLILNDYYESDMNSYKSGSILYPLTNLSQGTHTLTMRVWDVYNNSSSATTEFVVAASAKLALSHVLNYPNPFTTKTSFYFEHNECCINMDVQIQIFTVSGKLVKSIHQFVNMEGFRSEPIDWDGKDDYGEKIGRGVYIYRLRVKTSSNETAEQYEKLVILK